MPKSKMPVSSSNSVLFILVILSFIFIAPVLPAFMQRSRLLTALHVNSSGKPEYIPSSCQCSHKKEYDYQEICSQLFIQKHTQKGTNKNRDQHVDSKLPDHHQCLLYATAELHMPLPSKNPVFITSFTYKPSFLNYTHFFYSCLGK